MRHRRRCDLGPTPLGASVTWEGDREARLLPPRMLGFGGVLQRSLTLDV